MKTRTAWIDKISGAEFLGASFSDPEVFHNLRTGQSSAQDREAERLMEKISEARARAAAEGRPLDVPTN